MNPTGPQHWLRARIDAFIADESGATAIEYGVIVAVASAAVMGASDMLAGRGSVGALAVVSDTLTDAGEPGGGHTLAR